MFSKGRAPEARRDSTRRVETWRARGRVSSWSSVARAPARAVGMAAALPGAPEPRTRPRERRRLTNRRRRRTYVCYLRLAGALHEDALYTMCSLSTAIRSGEHGSLARLPNRVQPTVLSWPAWSSHYLISSSSSCTALLAGAGRGRMAGANLCLREARGHGQNSYAWAPRAVQQTVYIQSRLTIKKSGPPGGRGSQIS